MESLNNETAELIKLLNQEEKNINSNIQVEAIGLCSVLAEVMLRWQEKSPNIRDLSFSGADVSHQACQPIYHFLNKEDDVPLSVKVALCQATFKGFSLPYLETSYARVKEERVNARNPSCHWEKRRWRLRLQAHDLVLSQLPLIYQALGQMGYMHYATMPSPIASAA